MTIEVKKGSFEIKGSPIELLVLKQIIKHEGLALCTPDCAACSERRQMIVNIHDACVYNCRINIDEISSELARLNRNESKPHGDEQG